MGTRTPQGRYTSLRSRLAHAAHKTVQFLLISLGFVLASFIAGSTLSTDTIHAQVPDTITITPPLSSPVLDRIADCESGNGSAHSATQYDINGQVLLRANTNHTVDVGKYQINSVYFAKATALHYDLTTAAGNTAMANYIYANEGTGPWASSAHCWNK